MVQIKAKLLKSALYFGTVYNAVQDGTAKCFESMDEIIQRDRLNK